MRRLLQEFAATGIEKGKIERFLLAEPRAGEGTVRDQIAAAMANQLLGALGQPSTQSGGSVRRLRRHGAWRQYDRRPDEIDL
jgi:hypothetical protein